MAMILFSSQKTRKNAVARLARSCCSSCHSFPMVKPFIPPLPSARPSAVASTNATAGSAAAADQPPVGKENTANVTLSSSSLGTAKSASKVGVGSRGIPTNTRASPVVTDAATSHSITEDLTGASASSSTAIARTPARSALGGRPPKTGGSAIRSSSSAAAAAASNTPLAAPTPGGTQRVLRYGETVDSLFCLTSRTTDMHRQMCQDIVHGVGAEVDCAKSWRAAVEVAMAHADGAASSSTVGE